VHAGWATGQMPIAPPLAVTPALNFAQVRVALQRTRENDAGLRRTRRIGMAFKTLGGRKLGRLIIALPIAAMPFLAAPPAHADCDYDNPECSFLQWMAMFNITSPHGDQGLINTGHSICTDMQNGYSFAQERSVIREEYPSLNAVQIGRLIQNATTIFCPTTPMPLS
jgi:Protein of unknown function (DUF732)